MAERINVLKTYKIFIGGKFPRTESGRFYQLNHRSKAIANVCLSSRKDLRNAVVAARGAFERWSENKSIDEIKEEIKYVYSAYIRNYIWKNNWDEFFNAKHDLDAVKDWCIKMGSDRFRW